MASFYKLPSGLWRAQVARRGVRVSQTFATKGAAQAWATREESAILDGKADKWPRKTLADAIQRYLRDVTPTKGGKRAESIMLNHTLDQFPDLCGMVLHTITPAEIADWRDKRLADVSGSTVVRYAALLRHVWTVAAKEWGWTPEPTPWRSVKLPAHNPARERINGWREIRVILRRLNYKTGRPPQTVMEQVAYAWLIALRTALRASEVRSITPASVDLVGRVVRLEHHKTSHLTGRARTVPISKQAARLIALCPTLPVSAGSLDALFRKARDSAGLAGFTFHDSRATALTLLSKRVDVLTLARISGHRDLNQLQVYYRESAASIAARL
jgi:integrase